MNEHTGWYISIAFVVMFLVAWFWPDRSRAIQRSAIEGTARYIVDGDSLYLDTEKTQIRVWGIDAPEINEPGYHEAKNALARLAYRKRLRCERMDTDRYNRIVAKCFLPDGRDIAREMIKGGYALQYRRFTKGYYDEVDPLPPRHN